jgi:hypothetical protein
MLTPTILDSDGIFSNLVRSFVEFKFDGAAVLLLPFMLLILLPIAGCCDDCANTTLEGKAVNVIRTNSAKKTEIGINTFLFI